VYKKDPELIHQVDPCCMNNDINEVTVARAQVCENPLYNSWYALWTPVIQPALGILMLGVVLQVPCAPPEHPY
jgi:hypothetical protein